MCTGVCVHLCTQARMQVCPISTLDVPSQDLSTLLFELASLTETGAPGCSRASRTKLGWWPPIPGISRFCLSRAGIINTQTASHSLFIAFLSILGFFWGGGVGKGTQILMFVQWYCLTGVWQIRILVHLSPSRAHRVPSLCLYAVLFDIGLHRSILRKL